LKKEWKIGIAVAVVVLLVAFFILQACSLNMALRSAGISTNIAFMPVELDMEEDRQVKVIVSETDDGEIAVVRLQKNALGFWRIISRKESGENLTVPGVAWVKHARIRSFGTVNNTDNYQREMHFVYAGNNAQKLIEILPEQIPANTTVNIQQHDELYMIHVITFATESFEFNAYEVLVENGCIPPVEE